MAGHETPDGEPSAEPPPEDPRSDRLPRRGHAARLPARGPGPSRPPRPRDPGRSPPRRPTSPGPFRLPRCPGLGTRRRSPALPPWAAPPQPRTAPPTRRTSTTTCRTMTTHGSLADPAAASLGPLGRAAARRRLPATYYDPAAREPRSAPSPPTRRRLPPAPGTASAPGTPSAADARAAPARRRRGDLRAARSRVRASFATSLDLPPSATAPAVDAPAARPTRGPAGPRGTGPYADRLRRAVAAGDARAARRWRAGPPDPHRRGRRRRRRRSSPAGSSSSPGRGGSTQQPPGPPPSSPGRIFAPDPAAKADGRDQELLGVASAGSIVVAIGGEAGTADYRGEFLVSSDGGRSFRLADVRTAHGDEPGGGDTPRVVAGSDGAWVALGGSHAGTAVWTSRDGKSWIRQPDATGAAFGRDKITRVDAYAAAASSPSGTPRRRATTATPSRSSGCRRTGGTGSGSATTS